MAAKSTEAFQTCWDALVRNKSKIKALSGRTAVLYAGKTSSGDIWATLEARQREYLKQMGVEAPFCLLTDALDEIQVKVNAKSMSLNDAMFATGLMLPDERRRLWEEASRVWAINNDKVFLWRGSVEKDASAPIFDAIELPIQLLRNKKLTEFNTRQIKQALDLIRKRRPLDAELVEAEKEFHDLAEALEARDRSLRRYGFRDTHPELSKLTH